MAFTLFTIGMAAYYIWRMCAITPQYDELYTYYYFISRGPVYAAIHWPLPNNHVGFSVLSAVLNYCGNSYIGLRGVSYLCAVSNLIILYRICKRYFSHWLSFGAVVLYSSMSIVNEYSIQGRGYTLATTCFLIALYCGGRICNLDETSIWYYRAIGVCFVLGLYTVPSSIYWVIPVSLAICVYLIRNAYAGRIYHEKIYDTTYFRKFRKFFSHCFMAAVVTFFLYGIIWLAIGSNLLVKTEGSDLFGESHFVVLIRAPLRAMMTGIDYMLSQPYIQSLSSEDFYENVLNWAGSLFGYMLPGFEVIIPVFVVFSLSVALYECIRHFVYSRTIINLMVLSNVVITALMLFLQKKLPYLRVFSYGAVIVVLCICICLERLINVTIRMYNRSILKRRNELSKEGADHKESETTIKTGKWYSGIGVYIPVLTMVIIFVVRFSSDDFMAQLAHRESAVYNTLYVADVESRKNIAAIDCDQQFLLKFGWNIDCNKTDVDDADCVIIDKNLMQPGYQGSDFWKFYQTYDTINWDYISTMRAVYENESFILYIK